MSREPDAGDLTQRSELSAVCHKVSLAQPWPRLGACGWDVVQHELCSTLYQGLGGEGEGKGRRQGCV